MKPTFNESAIACRPQPRSSCCANQTKKQGTEGGFTASCQQAAAESQQKALLVLASSKAPATPRQHELARNIAMAQASSSEPTTLPKLKTRSIKETVRAHDCLDGHPSGVPRVPLRGSLLGKVSSVLALVPASLQTSIRNSPTAEAKSCGTCTAGARNRVCCFAQHPSPVHRSTAECLGLR